jgi:hypothetical protein
MTMLIWVVWGYKMGFGAHLIPGLVGIPGPVLSSKTELRQVSFRVFREVVIGESWALCRCLEESRG